MSSILLSQKHGLNPTIPRCFYCGEDKNEILLPGAKGDRLAKELGYSDGEMPMRGLVFDKEPCNKCKEWMRQGIILISVDKLKTTDPSNPYRTGKFMVIEDDAMRRILTVDLERATPEQLPALQKMKRKNEELLTHILKARVYFIPDDTWEKIGLPMKGTKEAADASKDVS